VAATDALAIVVVAHNSDAHLAGLIPGLLEQLAPDDELVVVDNASEDGTATTAGQAGAPVRLLRSPQNLGFGGGCHAGADATSAPLLFFLNADCLPARGCLAALRGIATSHPDWGAWQAAVMLPDGNINTDGGVVHYVGIGWAGDCDRPAAALVPHPREIAFASGAAMVIRRKIWDELGGFESSYFLYGEDLDLGLRLWLAGHPVGLAPAARVTHGYEFAKGAQKWFLLERNRWRTVLAVYPAHLLLLLVPALIAADLAVVAVAARDGWLTIKLRAQLAVLTGLPATLRRRRVIQRSRRTSTRDFALRLTASLESSYLPTALLNPAARAQAAYWQMIERLL
jgi:GT2 family glycosyltransferase